MIITHIGQRFIHNGGAEIFLRELSAKYFQKEIKFRQSICTDHRLYEKKFCDTFPHPVIIGGEKEITEAIEQGDALICWGNVNLNSMNLPQPKICIYNACAEVRLLLETSKKYITHAIACSTKTANTVCYDVPHSIILPGISTDRLAANNSKGLRKILGVADDEFLIGMIARLEDQKRQSWLIDAMRGQEKTKAIFVGDGPRLQSLKNSAPSNCLFVGHKENIGNWWSILDCYCLLSTNEGCSASLFEAMYLKVPIICTPVGSVCDLLDENSSIVVNNFKEFRKAIYEIKKRDKNKMTKLAFQKFEKYGKIKKTAYRWQNLLRKLDNQKCENLLS